MKKYFIFLKDGPAVMVHCARMYEPMTTAGKYRFFGVDGHVLAEFDPVGVIGWAEVQEQPSDVPFPNVTQPETVQ